MLTKLSEKLTGLSYDKASHFQLFSFVNYFTQHLCLILPLGYWQIIPPRSRSLYPTRGY